MAEISFFEEDVDFPEIGKSEVEKWLSASILMENKEVGDISIVFCSDEYLYNMNVSYLQHDTYTDIITFDYTEGDVISGDLFISTDRVKDNAGQFSVDFLHELHRVMVHGVMHLCGFKDKSPADAKLMRSKEDFYLSLQDN